MTTLNISLPDKMRAFVENKIKRGSYGTISEYIRELIRDDERAEQEWLDKLIAEAYASGSPDPHTKEDIDAAREETLRRIAARSKAK